MRQQQKDVITKNLKSIVNVKKKKSGKGYFRIYKQNVTENSAFKAREVVANRKYKHEARKDKDNKARELVANQKHMHKARQHHENISV